jgi:hypothetical protein
MMNKKLFALLVAIATVSAISAHYGECYRDENGYRHCEGVVSAPVQEGGNAVKRTGLFVGDVLSGGRASENYDERQEERRERREARRERARYND